MQVSALATQHTANRTVANPVIPDTLDLLEQFGTTVRLGREQELHPEGDPADFCYRVISGCVRTVRLMEDGRRQVGEFLLAGDMFGFDALETYDFAAETVSETVLRRYPRRMVEALVESRPDLARRLRDMALRNLRTMHERLVLLGRKTASERIASFLMEMGRRAGHGGRSLLLLPMCRTDIADHLGLTVETVCRVLAMMKREGVLTITRTGVDVCDPVALRALACDARH